MENPMTKKAKKPAKKAAAKTAAPVTTRPDGLRAGSKMAVMFDLALNTPRRDHREGDLQKTRLEALPRDADADLRKGRRRACSDEE